MIATGARWRRDGAGRSHRVSLPALYAPAIFTPDDILAGREPGGRVTVFDDDNYYLGAAIALHLATRGARVRYVTPEGRVGAWSFHTNEQFPTHRRLSASGIEFELNTLVTGFDGATLGLASIYREPPRRVDADALVLVTSREATDALYWEMLGERGDADSNKYHGSHPARPCSASAIARNRRSSCMRSIQVTPLHGRSTASRFRFGAIEYIRTGVRARAVEVFYTEALNTFVP